MLMFFLRLLWISAETRRIGAIQGAANPVIESPPTYVAHRPEQTEYGCRTGPSLPISPGPGNKKAPVPAAG